MTSLVSRLQKLGHVYSSVALILLNTCVLFVLINLVLYGLYKVRDSYFPDFYRIADDGAESLDKIYPDLTKQEIFELLHETWARPYVYEAFTQFKERPYAGKYLNVSEHGFRVTKNQGPWPPERTHVNVFLFGGSTTFNYGVPDRQTIASHLQDLLATGGSGREVRIYNFGRAHYYSTQERLLFERLLTAGHIPDVAIFIDGLNDFLYHEDELTFAEELRELFDSQQDHKTLLYMLRHLPMVRAYVGSTARFERSGEKGLEERLGGDYYKDETIQATVIERYLRNKKMIEALAGAFGVRPLFVWQPVPTYKYDLAYHPFGQNGFQGHATSGRGYVLMDRQMKTHGVGDHFLWCADIQEQLKEPLYVDRVHYTSKLSRMVAECIVASMPAREFVRIADRR